MTTTVELINRSCFPIVCSPKNGMILNTLALAFVRRNDYANGLRTLSAARKIHGNKPADFLVACLAFHGLGKPDKAKSMYLIRDENHQRR